MWALVVVEVFPFDQLLIEIDVPRVRQQLIALWLIGPMRPLHLVVELGPEKGKVAFALSEASRVLHSLDPDTYPVADSWVRAVKNKADITPGKLAERAGELMKRRKPGLSRMFVVDEGYCQVEADGRF